MKSVAAARPIKAFCTGIYDGPHATPKEAEAGPVFLGIKNITEDGRLDFTEIRHVSEDEFPRWTRRVIPQTGDVVFTYEATLHRYAVIPDGFRGCLGRRVALIRPDPAKAESRFLLYYFLSHGWRSVVESSIVSGATVDRIPLEKFPDFPARLPALDTQRRIAEILAAYDDLIENNRRRMTLLEEAARLIYQEWFLRLRFPGHEQALARDGTPEGWARMTLEDGINAGLIELQTGPFGTQLKASDYVEEGIPVVNVRNIGFGSVRAEKLEYVPEAVADRLSQHILRAGDIVFGRKGAVERHILVGRDEDGWMQGSDCIRLRALSDEVSTLLLSLAFREDCHKSWMLTQCSNKATMASLNQDVIGRIPFLQPTANILRAFTDIVADALQEIAILRQQARRAAQARDLLLPRLMSGEIEV